MNASIIKDPATGCSAVVVWDIDMNVKEDFEHFGLKAGDHFPTFYNLNKKKYDFKKFQPYTPEQELEMLRLKNNALDILIREFDLQQEI